MGTEREAIKRLSRAFALAVLVGAKGLRPSRGEPRRMTAEAKAGKKPKGAGYPRNLVWASFVGTVLLGNIDI